MDGFKRPRATSTPPPRSVNEGPTELPVVLTTENQSQDKESPLERPAQEKSTSSRFPRKWIIFGFVGLLIAGLIGGGLLWFNQQLTPVDSSNKTPQRVEVKDGAAFSYVASRLKERGLIRSRLAFDMYARLVGKRDAIKAGTCSFTTSESSKEILDKLSTGCHDFKSVTFYPGGTIEQPLYKPKGSTLDQTLYVKNMLSSAGYTDAQITSALAKTYSGPLFADKPAGTTLEGYVFGETYYVDTDATAEKVLQTAFDQMYKVIQRNNLVAGYKAQQLNLYQGITMASVVQSELDCEDKSTPERKERCYQYQRTIAQIFLKRLREGISLGSDVTFIYAANMQKVAPTVDIDSPYNTRIKVGLPPGPVSSPGELALKAVANPTDTDYVFFIAGDDGLIYFAKTDAEHQKNIENHCQIGCGEL